MIVLAVCLAALAGFVDAIAYSSLGGFFAAFMSGNVTRLGVALAARHYGDVRMAGALILSFVAGVMIAVTLLLGMAAAIMRFNPGSQALLLLAAAMGAESGINIGITHMAGALVRMGQGMAGALMGDAARWTWLRHLLLWLAFLLGVVIGARCYSAFEAGALWLATGAAGVLAIVIATTRRPIGQPGPWGSPAV